MGAAEKNQELTKSRQNPRRFSKFSVPFWEKFYSLTRPALFSLDPEVAHSWTVSGLAKMSRVGWGFPSSPPTGPGLATEVMGLRFPNPVGLAAGLDKDGECVDGFGALGFGFIEVGTLTPRPQRGNPRPRLFRIPPREAVINRMGFNNCGVEQGLANVATRAYTGILGVNIGKNFDTPLECAVDDYVIGFQRAARFADYVAVNLSSPNTKGLRQLQEDEACRNLVRRLKKEQHRQWLETTNYTPLAIKISPDISDDHGRRLAQVFLDGEIDAVIATNTTLARGAVRGMPFADEAGGLSGAPLTERSNELVALFAAETGGKIPVIGVGGIMTPADALAKLDAGASLIQLYTGLIYRGPALVLEILEALENRGNTPDGRGSDGKAGSRETAAASV
jgi:dihydroorotate dehydrogenase